MRGIFNSCVLLLRFDRFNPAYAGNIYLWGFYGIYSQVQPRVCGEYLFKRMDTASTIGSTPRMRGISITIFNRITQTRFNPAYAGNIIVGIRVFKAFQVQPRVCGEYCMP